MPVPSLLQLATATAIKHVKSLDDIGELPYKLVRPILMKVDNPEKLHAMELLSPHLIGEDQELWIDFIKRDIPEWDRIRQELPKESTQWYEIYCDLREDVQRALEADAEQMKMALDGIKSARTRLTPKIISGAQARASRSSKSIFRPRPFSGFSGVSAADRKKSAIFSAPRRNNALAVPTKNLSNRASQVRKAPRSLIEEHRQPSGAPAKSPLPMRRDQGAEEPSVSDRSRPIVPGGWQPPIPSALAEREARLRAAKGQPPGSEGTRQPSSSRPLPPSSSSRPTALKRSAESPLPSRMASSSDSLPRASSQNNGPSTSAPAPARPVMPVRKRPDSVFIQPKRRRVD
ncbi:hypothetical protein N7466_009295 [Penicillium verhagenii]|uniref:uncharacterized protein n=1 Tax=Penicillium verhagenii TaxID=1562060 RepID=UPI002545025B|nr:uncharacterized protein N7466_009295 [Penicillium verhagenii]KAJ5920969.1 hypothetical protein N7466_009295 [Penicillium verhagenii]